MSRKGLISRMSDECLMKQETVFLFYTQYQAVMRKFTLAGKSRFLRFASGSGTMHGLYRRGREIGGYLIGAVSAVCVAGGRRTGRIAAFEVLGAAALPDNLAA